MTAPDIRQEHDYDCGRVAVRVAAAAVGRDIQPDSIPCTPQDGIDPRTIEHVLRRAGLRVIAGEMTYADLLWHVRRGRPVLCPIQAHGGGHWVVVVGTVPVEDHAGDAVLIGADLVIHDPIDGRRVVEESEWIAAWHDADRLAATWERWGIAVCPPV